MKNLVLSIILLLPFVGFGQKLSPDFTISKSEPFKVVDAKSKEYVAVEDGNFTIAVKTDGERITIQKFDVKGMKEIARNVYEDFPKYTKIQKLLKIDGRVYYVFEAYNKKAKTFSVYSREIDIANTSFNKINKLFTTKGPVVVTGEIKQAASAGTFFNFGIMPKFEVVVSFDESKILIRYRNKPKVKDDSKNKDILGFYVFDNKFNQIWGKEVKMPHTEEDMNNLAYSVTGDGTAFMLAKINKSKSFELITVTEAGLKNQKLPIKKGLLFDEFHLKESANGNILAAGYYNNGTEFKADWTGSMTLSRNVNGLYVFEIGKDGIVNWEHDYPFSLKLIKQYLSDRQKKKADKRESKEKAGINDLLLRNFIVNDDGSIVIIGEVSYTRKEMWMTSMTYVTHFSNMVVTKIDPSGNLAWQKKLPKNQAALANKYESVGGLGMSYIQGEGAHYLIFADNRKNAKLTMDKPAEPHKGGFGGYLTAYKIDDDTGEIEKHLILDLTDIKGVKAYQFYVTRIFEAMDKTFLLEVYIKGKKDMVVKMELN